MQLPLPGVSDEGALAKERPSPANGRANKLLPSDRAFHDWYRFVLSYPPHLVRDYMQRFGLDERSVVLDPFCGTGTTLIEAKLAGMRALGIEANPFAHFASSVKLDWSIEPNVLQAGAKEIADATLRQLKAEGIDDEFVFIPNGHTLLRKLDPEAAQLLLTDSISPVPLHKTLVLLEQLNQRREAPFYRHALLALASALVFRISNLHFGPEVGVRSVKQDIPVVSTWLAEVGRITADLRPVVDASYPVAEVHLADARLLDHIAPTSVDAVITSPPYPNEKDYTRTTRLESVLLGFISTKAELRELKQQLVRSNTRGVYKNDDDDRWVADQDDIQRIAEDIERRRIALNKDSGFERLYGRVTKLYFGGMARHFAELRRVLKPGAQIAYVVGDQASYLQVMIRTGQLLAEIAESLNYEVVRIDLFRTRMATATREQLREEVVVLRWRGV
jgi:DNA modification methylase